MAKRQARCHQCAADGDLNAIRDITGDRRSDDPLDVERAGCVQALTHVARVLDYGEHLGLPRPIWVEADFPARSD